MANSYTQIHIQFAFAVKYRAALINNEWERQIASIYHRHLSGK
jgi:putative transposase